jgi:hypothetical protein
MLKCFKCFEDYPFLIEIIRQEVRKSVSEPIEIITRNVFEGWCQACVVQESGKYLRNVKKEGDNEIV